MWLMCCCVCVDGRHKLRERLQSYVRAEAAVVKARGDRRKRAAVTARQL